jgi:hypothetical protein
VPSSPRVTAQGDQGRGSMTVIDGQGGPAAQPMHHTAAAMGLA